MNRITITIDDDLMAELDRMISLRGYPNRSEALRDLARAGLRQAAVENDALAECVGVVSYVYDHMARDLARRLTRSHHHHHDMSMASLHVHLDHDHCLEVSVLKGKPHDVHQFADAIISQRAVSHGGLQIIPTPGARLADGHEHNH